MKGLTLLGLGTVGTGVARACAAEGSRWRVAKALVRDPGRPRAVALPAGTLTADVEEIIAGEGPVVEVLGGEQPAADLIARLLALRRPVVTANKVVIAAHGPRLFAIARWHGASLGIEACVGGGVPVVAALRQLAGGQRLTAIGGVLNGTTNAILGAMERGRSYDEALQAAQDAGFAEPDPTADVEGHDAAAKLAILAALAFGIYVDPATIARRPLADVAADDLRWAAAHGGRVKYVAAARLNAERVISAAVEPVALPAAEALARPEGPGNAIRVEGELIGITTLSGPGAGAAPTAGALLGDLAAIEDGALSLNYPAPGRPAATVIEPVTRYAVRLPGSVNHATISHEARWARDGDDWIGLVEAATGSALGAVVRAVGGTLVRWNLPSW